MPSRALFSPAAAPAAPFRAAGRRAAPYIAPRQHLAGPQLQHRREAAARAKQTYKLELEANESVDVEVDVPEGTEVYSVALAKPIGITLEEKEGGKIVVGEVKEGSNASQASTKINIGDELLAASGREMEGQGGKTVEGSKEDLEQRDSLWGPPVMVNAKDEGFDTIMAAIQSQSASKSKTALVFARSK